MKVKHLKQYLNNINDELDVMTLNSELNAFYPITTPQIDTVQITDGKFSDNQEWVKNDIPAHNKQIVKIIKQKQILII